MDDHDGWLSRWSTYASLLISTDAASYCEGEPLGDPSEGVVPSISRLVYYSFIMCSYCEGEPHGEPSESCAVDQSTCYALISDVVITTGVTKNCEGEPPGEHSLSPIEFYRRSVHWCIYLLNTEKPFPSQGAILCASGGDAELV